MEPLRKFKIIVDSKKCGTCSGATPSAVAKKVVKKLCGTSSKVVKFSLKECKRGCERVCGPYQGRIEKLDRPYTRSGKKITHRVVCGKVKKMRGGEPNFSIIKEDIKKKLIALKQQFYSSISPNKNYPEQRREFLKNFNKTTKKELLKLYNNKFIEYQVNDPLQNNRYQTNNNHYQEKLEHFNKYLQTINDEIIPKQFNVANYTTFSRIKKYFDGQRKFDEHYFRKEKSDDMFRIDEVNKRIFFGGVGDKYKYVIFIDTDGNINISCINNSYDNVELLYELNKLRRFLRHTSLLKNINNNAGKIICKINAYILYFFNKYFIINETKQNYRYFQKKYNFFK